MQITWKFYTRYGEALKHMRAVSRWTPAHSHTAHATEAVTLRLEGPAGAVQVIKMSAKDAGLLGAVLCQYAMADMDARGTPGRVYVPGSDLMKQNRAIIRG